MSMYFDIQPVPADGGFRMDDQWVWCGSVVKGDDGLYHMFASAWTKDVPFAPNWLTNSRVVRATSPTAAGPYTFAETVLPPHDDQAWDAKMSHNPTIHRVGDTYYLFYTGARYDAPMPDRDHPDAQPCNPTLGVRFTQRVGVATAPSPAGPWTRYDKPVLGVRPGKWDAGMTTNPAFCAGPDGRFYLAYKSIREHGDTMKYGLAVADDPAGPYTRLLDEPALRFDRDLAIEDACLWHDGDRFHMIFKDMSGDICGEKHGGAKAVSNDAVHWQLDIPVKAWSRTLHWSDGRTISHGSVERPQLLIEGGTPTHLFVAISEGETPWFAGAKQTFNIGLPIG